MLKLPNARAPKRLSSEGEVDKPNKLTLSSPKQRQGGEFEQLAVAYLHAQGLRLVAQNWLMPKVGELDLVMVEPGQSWNTLVFVEVRQRALGVYGDAVATVTVSKQRKLIKTAKYFLRQHPQYRHDECRFDVVAYTDKLAPPQWITGAFVAAAWP